MNIKTSEEMQADIESLQGAVASLSNNLKEYNDRLSILEKQSNIFQKEAMPVQYIPTPRVETVFAPTPIAQEERESTFDVFKWMAIDWPVKVGAFLLLLGVGWFVSYAFMNNWIGPVGRIALGVLLGIGIIGLGQWRFRTSTDQGSIFVGLGAVSILVTLFAARVVYDFFTPFTALLMMGVVVAYIAYTSVVYRNMSLSFMSLIAGSIVPFLIVSGEASFVSLFAYLFVLSLGMVWVVSKTGTKELLFALMSILFLYSMPYTLGGVFVDTLPAFIFALAFATMFFVLSFATMMKNGRIDAQDLLLSGFNSVSLILWIGVSVGEDWKSFVALCISLALSLAAYVLAQSMPQNQSLSLMRFASAVVFLVAATVFEFSGAVLTIAFAIEAGVLFLIATQVTDDVAVVKKISWLIWVPVYMSGANILRYALSRDVFTQDFFVLLVMTIVLLMMGMVTKSFASSQGQINESLSLHSLSGIFLIGSGIYLSILIWYVLHIGLSVSSIATFIALVIYTISGLVLYIQGKSRNEKQIVFVGGALLMWVIARLLLVDIWQMSIMGRIVTFFIVGALFMSTAFIGKNKSN